MSLFKRSGLSNRWSHQAVARILARGAVSLARTHAESDHPGTAEAAFWLFPPSACVGAFPYPTSAEWGFKSNPVDRRRCKSRAVENAQPGRLSKNPPFSSLGVGFVSLLTFGGRVVENARFLRKPCFAVLA